MGELARGGCVAVAVVVGMISVLLSATVKRFSVSRMWDFKLKILVV